MEKEYALVALVLKRIESKFDLYSYLWELLAARNHFQMYSLRNALLQQSQSLH